MELSREIKQVNTNISFEKLPSEYDVEDVIAYRSHIRYLTLLNYKFILGNDSEGHYIASTTGLWRIDKHRFLRLNEDFLSLEKQGINSNDISISNDCTFDETLLTYYKERAEYGTCNSPLVTSTLTLKSNVPYKKIRELVSNDLIEQIIEDESYVVQDLARKYNVSLSTVYSIRLKHLSKHSDSKFLKSSRRSKFTISSILVELVNLKPDWTIYKLSKELGVTPYIIHKIRLGKY